jgi:hypothetical protein
MWLAQDYSVHLQKALACLEPRLSVQDFLELH